MPHIHTAKLGAQGLDTILSLARPNEYAGGFATLMGTKQAAALLIH